MLLHCHANLVHARIHIHSWKGQGIASIMRHHERASARDSPVFMPTMSRTSLPAAKHANKPVTVANMKCMRAVQQRDSAQGKARPVYSLANAASAHGPNRCWLSPWMRVRSTDSAGPIAYFAKRARTSGFAKTQLQVAQVRRSRRQVSGEELRMIYIGSCTFFLASRVVTCALIASLMRLHPFPACVDALRDHCTPTGPIAVASAARPRGQSKGKGVLLE